jgi:hypothetical protein
MLEMAKVVIPNNLSREPQFQLLQRVRAVRIVQKFLQVQENLQITRIVLLAKSLGVPARFDLGYRVPKR